MFRARIPLDRKLRFEDFLRSLGYIAIGFWSILYAFHPSAIVNAEVQPWVQFLWLGVSLIGAIFATTGCLLKIDIKLELPGILFMLIGPLLYFCTTTWRAFNQSLIGEEQPAGLIPLIVYSFLPVILLLPRIFDLYSNVLTSKARAEDQGRLK